MAPHIEQLKSIASMFAGETGLTLDDLGFNTQNPSSAEAIKAGHETLRLITVKAQKCFSVGFKNVVLSAHAFVIIRTTSETRLLIRKHFGDLHSNRTQQC
jgi:hypothetical protein